MPLTDIQRLAKQLEDLDIPFVDDFPNALASSDHVVDAIFGLFRGLFHTDTRN